MSELFVLVLSNYKDNAQSRAEIKARFGVLRQEICPGYQGHKSDVCRWCMCFIERHA